MSKSNGNRAEGKWGGDYGKREPAPREPGYPLGSRLERPHAPDGWFPSR